MSSFREDLPNCAESVDFLKTLFGDDVKVEAAYENGIHHISKAKTAEAQMIVIDGEHYLRLGKLGKMQEDEMRLAEERKRARK